MRARQSSILRIVKFVKYDCPATKTELYGADGIYKVIFDKLQDNTTWILMFVS